MSRTFIDLTFKDGKKLSITSPAHKFAISDAIQRGVVNECFWIVDTVNHERLFINPKEVQMIHLTGSDTED